MSEAPADPETEQPSPQEILARIQAGLKSEKAQPRLDAIQTLNELPFSSPAILRILEELAVKDENNAVREAARQTLASPTHRYIYSRLTDLKLRERQIILGEINEWENRGLIQPDLAEVIRQRYEFDLQPAIPALVAPALRTETGPASVKEAAQPPKPGTPRPSLAQTLLSETSIKIALYLGAFFVIAAAAILAAIVEAARLPILLAATALFAGSAIFTRARLPQPSFALFIVFSFLLPTDANVLADMLHLSSRAGAGYWSAVMAGMALIWSFGAWFYASRLFSLAAFSALALAVFRLGDFLESEPEIYLILGSTVTLLGLGGAFWLKRWRNTKFSLPLLILVQVSQLGLVGLALIMIAVRFGISPSGWNFASTFFWVLTALFYALSDLAFPFAIFPWLAVAALYPLPLNLMLAIKVEVLPVAIASWIWGLLLSSASALSGRLRNGKARQYELPFLIGSLAVILTAVMFGLSEGIVSGFVFLLISAILYTLFHGFKPRALVWTAALSFGLGAYFSFFSLPFLENIHVFFGYQMLGAGLLLLLPDLFLAPDFSADKAWRWPLRALGAGFVLLNLALILPLASNGPGQPGIGYGVYALFFLLYALKFKRAWLGYFATASAAISVLFVLQSFELDAWLPALTVLSAVYYLAGLLLGQNEDRKGWSNMVGYSGLALASLASLWALATLEESGGWYVLIAALLFGSEMFSHRESLAEAGLQLFLASGVFLLLREAGLQRGYQGLGIALAILGTDLGLHRAFPGKRVLAWASRGVAALVIGLNSLDLLVGNSGSQVAAICFGIYMLFFLAMAWFYRQPVLGYGFSLYSALTVIFTLQTLQQTQWMLPVTFLAIAYYMAGFFLRKNQAAVPADPESVQAINLRFRLPFVLWTSGLGAGLLATLAAPEQGGLAAAIPPAVTATMVAVEAFQRRNVWLGFPANALYLMSYFIILWELKVDEPQFYSVATAALGLLMHYLLTRSGSRAAAFITGMVSQLVLLSITYLQFLGTHRLLFFAVIFFQALAVLAYGIVIRSRSLVVTPIAFAVLAVVTALYGLLEGIWPVILIGCTGIILLLLGILAVLLRERFKLIGERFAEWSA